MRHWSEVDVRRKPRKRNGRNDRVRRKAREEEAPSENRDDGGSPEGGAEAPIPAEAPPVEGDLGRGNPEVRGADAAPRSCTKCGGGLSDICSKCEDPLEARAQETLEAIGAKFTEAADKDLATAFAEYAKDMIRNQAVFVASKVISLDAVARMVQSIHTMIGAPKKDVESKGGADAGERLSGWLNGGEVPEFAKASSIKLPPLVEEGIDLEPEEEAEEVEVESGG